MTSNYWNDRTILITGAGGFIGSHLAEHLVKIGARTRALVRYNSAGSWGLLDASPLKNEIEVFSGDIRDRESMRKAVKGVDVIFHLQGQSPYSASKIGADKIAEAFHLSYGLPAVTIRPFNTYGPRQSIPYCCWFKLPDAGSAKSTFRQIPHEGSP